MLPDAKRSITAKEIRLYRILRGLTRMELSKLSGYSVKYLKELEVGGKRLPDRTANHIMLSLGLDWKSLEEFRNYLKAVRGHGLNS